MLQDVSGIMSAARVSRQALLFKKLVVEELGGFGVDCCWARR